MTPEGICSREPRCRFDDCYFVIKVNRNKNELVTKQLIHSSAWPRRGSLGKAGQWCSHCWEEQAAPQKYPRAKQMGQHPLGFTVIPPALCLSKLPQTLLHRAATTKHVHVWPKTKYFEQNVFMLPVFIHVCGGGSWM